MLKIAIFPLVLLMLSACASSPHPHDLLPVTGGQEDSLPADESIDDTLMEKQSRAIEKLKNRSALKIEKTAPQPVYSMRTLPRHPKVKKWIKYYSQKDRARFQRFLNRGAKYKEVIQDLLVTNGLPPDLYYLGILESGYVTKAISRAGAVGPWQFMAPTGRQYGLKIDEYTDERIDPIRSTLAAIRYLKELYRIKKSWPLAMAAYNAGPGRVRGAIRRGGVNDYWHLSQRRLLPHDTREYVPQFMAILTIGKNLRKYGFIEKPKEVLKPMELVKVPSPVPLKKIASISQLPLKTLKTMNPHLVQGLTPPGATHYPLWVEKGYVSRVSLAYNKISKHRISGLKARQRLAQNTKIHRVRRGQHLTMIARRYGTSVGKIKRLNNLRSSRIYVGQKLRVKSRAPARVASKKLPVARKSYYVVRPGDNLTHIAKRHGTTVSKLKRVNGLKKTTIYKGQKLKLEGQPRLKSYKILPGDNLYKIARKFGVSVKQIKAINNLTSNRILRGQYLKIAVH